MQRRDFINRCFVAPTLLSFSTSIVAQNRQTLANVAYIAAAQSRLGEHSLQCFNSQNELIAHHDIPSRGHGFAVHPQLGYIAAIARRPADYCFVLDRSGNKIAEIHAQQDRHFYGHGVFALNGNYLFLTENDFGHARGVIGVYDASDNFARIGEYNSYGIGPHMIQLDKSGQQLIVANGGIETHPNTGRKKLNLDTMKPSLDFIDLKTGELIKKAQLASDYHKNSIRHFCVASDNTIYLGLQNEGDSNTAALLAKLTTTSDHIEKLTMPAFIAEQLDNYVGDICLDESGQYLSASSPYGNSLIFINTEDRQTSSYSMDDVCAVSATRKPNQFIVSSGTGSISLVDLSSGLSSASVRTITDFSSGLAWDNHLASIFS